MTATYLFPDLHADLPTAVCFFRFHALKLVVAVHALADGFGVLVFYTAEKTEGTASEESATSAAFVDALSALRRNEVDIGGAAVWTTDDCFARIAVVCLLNGYDNV